jgi:hypothetical protein
MVLAFNNRTAFVSFLAVIILSMALILVAAKPSYADRIIAVHQYTTLAVGCDLSKGNDLIGTTKVLTYDQPTKLIFNCERSGGDVDLKKGESISIRCLHDNHLTIPKHAKIKAGELFYIICK